VLVRHADTAPDSGSNPPLTAAGAKRAQDLAATLRDTKFSAVITTQLIRTRDTAQPVVAVLGLTPEVVNLNPAERETHIKTMVAAVRKHAGGSLLVVGHSGTVPGIIAALGGPRLPDICETVFDNLFMLVPVAGKVQFVHARYGAPSPTPGQDCK
jgi:broad specificity phosphatase PhoE